MSNDDNPLIKALPPETDYYTYLTILEYNLTQEQLPVLHNILQDVTLTSNIGWDLVHLLIPLLPDSEPCLQVVAHLGNPREVILKVTELLEAISKEQEDEDHSQEDQLELASGEDEETGKGTDGKEEQKAVHTQEGHGTQNALLKLDEMQDGPPSPSTRFQALIKMLSTLHPRITTQYPSRFLSTSLLAVLPAYERVISDSTCTDAILSFIKSISGSKKPPLPLRMSSSSFPESKILQSAPDPEASLEPSDTQDLPIYARLLQSFLTHVVDIYVASLPVGFDQCRFSWTSRLQEKSHPEKIVPGRKTFSSMFTEIDSLRERDTKMGHIIALAGDLQILPQELYSIVIHPEVEPSGEANELPSSASDISLAYTGSLYLLSAMLVSSSLFNIPLTLPPLRYLSFVNILENFCGGPQGIPLATNQETILDAALVIGFVTSENMIWANEHEDEDKDEDGYDDDTPPRPFQESKSGLPCFYQLSNLTFKAPSILLRSHAYTLTSIFFHSHPSDLVKYNYVKSLLVFPNHSFDSLKPSVVGWLKDEILYAAKGTSSTEGSPDEFSLANLSTLSALEKELFSISHYMGRSTKFHRHVLYFQTEIPFFLSVLNLYYLLCSSKSIYDRIYSQDPEHALEVMEPITLRFIAPLKGMTQRVMSILSKSAASSDSVSEFGALCSPEGMLELVLLDNTIDRAFEAFDRFKAKAVTDLVRG